MSWLKKENNFECLGFATIAPSNSNLLHRGVKAQGGDRHNGQDWTRRTDPRDSPVQRGGGSHEAVTQVWEKSVLCPLTHHTLNLLEHSLKHRMRSKLH